MCFFIQTAKVQKNIHGGGIGHKKTVGLPHRDSPTCMVSAIFCVFREYLRDYFSNRILASTAVT